MIWLVRYLIIDYSKFEQINIPPLPGIEHKVPLYSSVQKVYCIHNQNAKSRLDKYNNN